MKAKTSSILTSEKRIFTAMFVPAFAALIILGIIPVVSIFVTSMLNWEIVTMDQAKFIWFDNFIQMFKDDRFFGSLGVQFFMSIASVTLQLLVGLLFALIFHRATGFVKAMRTVIVFPYVIPPVVVALIWLTLLTPSISPINALLESIGIPGPEWLTVDWLAVLSLIIADSWHGFPFSALILLAALQNIPVELYESAEVDGANRWQTTLHISLPSISWAIIFCAVIKIIESFKSFPLIFIMTGGGPGTSTEVTNFYAYLSAFQYGHLGYASALSFSMFVVTAILSYLILRSNRQALYR